MLKDKLSRKIISILFVFGVASMMLAYGFFYATSIAMLEERGAQQMDSVRALATEKLRLYFLHLKTSVLFTSAHGVFTDITVPGELRDSFLAIYELNAVPELIFGKPVAGTEAFEALPRNSVELTEHNQLVLKAACRKTECVWVFSLVGVNAILSERRGLGKTGEIYLVGPDHWITSASRHLSGDHSAKVVNESIRLGNENQYGVHKVKDYRGVEVLSAFSPFSFDGLDFVILSEIDRNEIISPLKDNLPWICGAIVLLLGIVFSLSWLAARRILSLMA